MDALHSNLHDIADHRDDNDLAFGRGASSVRRSETVAVAPTIAGAGWYHDAAIETARLASIDARCNPYG